MATWLRRLLGVQHIYSNGELVSPRSNDLDFREDADEVEYNPSTGRIEVPLGSGGGTADPLTVFAYASVASGLFETVTVNFGEGTITNNTDGPLIVDGSPVVTGSLLLNGYRPTEAPWSIVEVVNQGSETEPWVLRQRGDLTPALVRVDRGFAAGGTLWVRDEFGGYRPMPMVAGHEILAGTPESFTPVPQRAKLMLTGPDIPPSYNYWPSVTAGTQDDQENDLTIFYVPRARGDGEDDPTGGTVPAPPPAGTYTLKAIDGVLTWVADS